MRVKLLIVDDERTTRMALAEAFSQRNYDVDMAASGDQALAMITAVQYDTVLLDLQMPGLTGDQLLAMADKIAPDTAFVVLTAYASAETAITALRSGAVDYLRKPSTLETIFAAVEKAVQKQYALRSQRQAAQMLEQIRYTLETGQSHLPLSYPASTPEHILQVGKIRINENSQTVLYEQTPVDLTPIEYRLLRTLAGQPNTMFSYAELARTSHEAEMDEDEARTLLRTHVHRLRHKLSNMGSESIQTVRGRGVILQN